MVRNLIRLAAARDAPGMKKLLEKKLSANITVHGKGEIGGKGEGLVTIDRIPLRQAHKLKAEIFANEFYERYRNNGYHFDSESLEHLRAVHASFSSCPISVRASERLENDPYVPSSGESSSYMLPNQHPDVEERFDQLVRSIAYLYGKFGKRAAEQQGLGDGVAFLINPIPGIASATRGGRFYSPMSSGAADSFFKHPLNLEDGLQDPQEGFARVAFGHGYAVVRNDFDVIPLATIRNPISPRLMNKRGQRFFYAIDFDGTKPLSDDEMSTLSMLHVDLASPESRAAFEDEKGNVNFDRLVAENAFDYMSDLQSLMDQLSAHLKNFQIEFTWNLVDGKGVFHIVQYRELRDLDLSNFAIPQSEGEALIHTDQFGGHGVTKGVRFAVVISPFNYQEEMHGEVLQELRRINREMRQRGEKFVFVCPGRIGTTNRKWGFNIEFSSITSAAAIVEYGYDIKGSPSIDIEHDEMTGGIYGSHFLYQILGGADEAERRRRMRMFGSQGTHFFTNLYTNGTCYLFVHPNENYLASWFFSPPEELSDKSIFVKEFERPVTIYANLLERRSLVSW